jgi:recombination protein RecT
LVYDHDEFDIGLGTDPFVFHKPSQGKDRGNYKGAYAWSKTKRGEYTIEWMTQADIEDVRKVSQMRNAGAWKDWWGEMARKSVIRRLAKRLPLHTTAAAALAAEEEADKLESGEDQEVRATRKRTLELLAQSTELAPEEAAQIAAAVEAVEEPPAEAQPVQ